MHRNFRKTHANSVALTPNDCPFAIIFITVFQRQLAAVLSQSQPEKPYLQYYTHKVRMKNTYIYFSIFCNSKFQAGKTL